MTKEATFFMKLETDLREAFMAATEAAHRPAAQVVRELMREYIARQREAREYEEFLHRKVDTARGQARKGRGRSSEVVEAEFAARRAEAITKK
jgi:hypothetical protein